MDAFNKYVVKHNLTVELVKSAAVAEKQKMAGVAGGAALGAAIPGFGLPGAMIGAALSKDRNLKYEGSPALRAGLGGTLGSLAGSLGVVGAMPKDSMNYVKTLRRAGGYRGAARFIRANPVKGSLIVGVPLLAGSLGAALGAGSVKTSPMKKIALKMSDVEDDLGFYLDKKHHGKVRKMIEERKGKSFSLRHPYLTGIPTLGIAPAIARANATEKIKRNLLRGDKGLRKAHAKAMGERHRRDMDERRADIEREKALAPYRAASALGSAYVAGKQIDRDR
jgi:hypothetical protein